MNWPWLGTCLVAMASAGVALGAMLWVTFFHYWRTWPQGILECACLAIVLAFAAFGQRLSRRAFEQMVPPNHFSLDPRTAPFALLPEVLILLLLPLVAVAAPLLWAVEWPLELHFVGLPHGLSFHLIRSFESLWVGAFLFCWVRDMTAIQGRIACSLIRQR